MADITIASVVDNYNGTVTIRFTTAIVLNWVSKGVSYGPTSAYGNAAPAVEIDPTTFESVVTPDSQTFHFQAFLQEVDRYTSDDQVFTMSAPVPPDFTNPTGKTALLASFNTWLQSNVPTSGSTDFTYSFLQQLAPQVMPRVEVTEMQYYNPGQTAFGGIIFPGATGEQQALGKANRVLMQIDIYSDQAKGTPGVATPAARQILTKIRDRIVYALENAGVLASNGDISVTAIPLLDPSNSMADTGTMIRVLTEEDNWLSEKYFPPTPEKPTIHQYQLLVKLEWYEMRS